jgi:phosphoribosylamine--glycine ligase
MRKYGIPTADYEVFYDLDPALVFVRQNEKWPCVVKADGTAVGKGVYICADKREAEDSLRELMVGKKFGKSGECVVIEEYLEGQETTVLAFCDGKTIVQMLSSADYKKAFDGDMGPNTGGMGAVCPSPYYTAENAEAVNKKIIQPTLKGLISENIEYKGILYFGLMFTKFGPYVIEYNSRFGDPETQAVLPLLQSDLLEVCFACLKGTLDKQSIKWDNSFCSLCVVLASGGYPGVYAKGFPVRGIDAAGDSLIFHAGTADNGEGIITSGGRVLGVVSTGGSINEAARKAYGEVSKINFENMFYRTDIGGIG